MKKSTNHIKTQEEYWEYAGKIGYDKAIFSGLKVERHIRDKHKSAVLKAAFDLNLNKESIILELGCGDGSFAKEVLSPNFGRIDAFDQSKAAIERAIEKSFAKNVYYHVQNIEGYVFNNDNRWDGAFLMGFLHHVKPVALSIVKSLSKVTPLVILAEPNGDNIIRKSLELLPSYSRAGEQSFRFNELLDIFKKCGYRLHSKKLTTLIPPFLPEKFLCSFKHIESVVEENFLLRKACSTYILSFTK